MAKPGDVPASKLIERLALYLKENVDDVSPPPWADVVKTGAHAQRPPENPDWWYVRCASLLRKLYVHGPMGVGKLRAKYGGRKDYGVRPEHAVRASGAVIRKALQQLEAAGLVEKFQDGRRLTMKGRRLLEDIAKGLMKDLVKDVPELMKYVKGA